MKLVFITNANPLQEDAQGNYSRIRFYSETITKLAKAYSCDEVNIVYPNESFCFIEANIPEYENCNYLKSFNEQEGILTRFQPITSFLSNNSDEYITVFGILNGHKFIFQYYIFMYSKIIKDSNCLFYHYLSSDAELTKHPYVSPGKVSFLSEFSSLEQIFVSKLKSVIITEVEEPDILDNYHSKNIYNIDYLPLIINYEERVNKFHSEDNIVFGGRCILLNNLDSWKNVNHPILSVFKNNLTVYGSFSINLRKENLGIEYKPARFWKLEEYQEILRKYSYYVGASSPYSHRFTYKIVEAAAASTVCLLPSISLKSLRLENTESNDILEVYQELIGTLSSEKSLKTIIKNAEDESYYRRLLYLQESLLKEYFSYDSHHINSLIQQIVR